MKQLPGWASLSKVAEHTLSGEGRGRGIGSLRLKVRPGGHKCVCFKERGIEWKKTVGVLFREVVRVKLCPP